MSKIEKLIDDSNELSSHIDNMLDLYIEKTELEARLSSIKRHMQWLENEMQHLGGIDG